MQVFLLFFLWSVEDVTNLKQDVLELCFSVLLSLFKVCTLNKLSNKKKRKRLLSLHSTRHKSDFKI